MIQGARGSCTGMTQRDRMGREMEGRVRMGNTYIPMVDSCQCMAKAIQYCKVKLKKKGRDITLPTKVRLVKAMVFPVVTYGCVSWTIKKAECRRIDAFELWCWRRLLRVP